MTAPKPVLQPAETDITRLQYKRHLDQLIRQGRHWLSQIELDMAHDRPRSDHARKALEAVTELFAQTQVLIYHEEQAAKVIARAKAARKTEEAKPAA